MQFKLVSEELLKNKQDTLVLVLTNCQKLDAHAVAIDKITGGAIKRLITTEKLAERSGECFMLFDLPKVSFKRILIAISTNPLQAKGWKALCNKMVQTLNQSRAQSVLCCFDQVQVEQRCLGWCLEQFIISQFQLNYELNDFNSKTTTKRSWQKTHFFTNNNEHKKLKTHLTKAQALCEGLKLCQDLGNTPVNICIPEYLAKTAKKMGEQYEKLKVTVLDEKQMKKLNMNMLLAVGQGSIHPPRLICLDYRGGKTKDAPIVFVGKGITFDTGGYSIKGKAAMLGMKYDMLGGATVMGLINAVAKAKLPINVIGIVASAENKVASNALLPESVITTMSGLKVEVTNTDAEGRLVLCDALTYAERYKPKYVIDIATLTGGIIIALGSIASGLFCEDEQLGRSLLEAGQHSLDRAWPMPLWDDYDVELQSAVADIMNAHTPKTAGTSIVAARFLAHFTKKFRWAHIDCAGVANSGRAASARASGRPIPMLWQFLLNELKSK